MKDMNLLEILTDILYYPFENNLYNIKDLSDVKKEMISVIIYLFFFLIFFFFFEI